MKKQPHQNSQIRNLNDIKICDNSFLFCIDSTMVQSWKTPHMRNIKNKKICQ